MNPQFSLRASQSLGPPYVKQLLSAAVTSLGPQARRVSIILLHRSAVVLLIVVRRVGRRPSGSIGVVQHRTSGRGGLEAQKPYPPTAKPGR